MAIVNIVPLEELRPSALLWDIAEYAGKWLRYLPGVVLWITR